MQFFEEARGDERLVYDWVVQFIDIYHTRHNTPHIHAMKCHVEEFLRLHGAILPFTQQGLEKYNDVITKNFFGLVVIKGTKPWFQSLKNKTNWNIYENPTRNHQ